MPRVWEDRKDVDLDASPEQVWEAVATGPGIDSWYMGHSQVEPSLGGMVRTAIGAGALESIVTHWEPPHRFAYRGHASADGRFIAFEFQIEGQAGGSTALRLVSSGFLPGDDWEAEYEAMKKGGDL
ncbi:MAG TPA: SRPBCC domain-containing protein, partial [Chloroflexota bacterium]|nr:SRPBCC domain-containing protein [Chloroflexota bacterium]